MMMMMNQRAHKGELALEEMFCEPRDKSQLIHPHSQLPLLLPDPPTRYIHETRSPIKNPMSLELSCAGKHSSMLPITEYVASYLSSNIPPPQEGMTRARFTKLVGFLLSLAGKVVLCPALTYTASRERERERERRAFQTLYLFIYSLSFFSRPSHQVPPST